MVHEAIAVIKAEHRSLATVLDAVLYLIGEYRARRLQPDFKLLWTMLYYIEAFPEKLHHPKEDRFLFERLRARAPEAGALIDELQRQHRGGEKRVHDLQAALGHFEAGAPGGFEEFARAMETFADFNWRHIATEEKDMMPLARAHLTDEDWAVVTAAFKDNNDPMFGKEQDDQFRRLFTNIVNWAPPPLGLGPAAAPEPPRRGH